MLRVRWCNALALGPLSYAQVGRAQQRMLSDTKVVDHVGQRPKIFFSQYRAKGTDQSNPYDAQYVAQRERAKWVHNLNELAKSYKNGEKLFHDDCYTVSFNRSSGPGGQNVNKGMIV